MRRLLALVITVVISTGCTSAPDGRVSAVAALYPLAWVVREVGGPSVEVTDLTPPGAEAHDATLTAGQLADLQTADVVVYLGDLGFQPDVERAIDEATGGEVVDVGTSSSSLRPGGGDLRYDPHVWLDPVRMQAVVARVADALAEADPEHASAYRHNADDVIARLGRLDAEYRNALTDCRFSTFVVTHEAFGYLAARYGLEQAGIQGIAPESEPSASRIQSVVEAIRNGDAAPAVFYEDTDEGRRIAESVSADAGVPSFALGTLESDPGAGTTYEDVMGGNLASLRKGLQCATA